uniref:Protein SSUH2 homolog n=1 Tax=Callorhinchus milii TaxID=7868 RepID=A0A4W3KL14_CALMI
MDSQPLLSDAKEVYGISDPQILPFPSNAATASGTQCEDGPTAPPADMLDEVAGYEGTIAGGGEERYLPPPVVMPEDATRDLPAPRQDWRIPSISEDTAREAFIQFATTKWCYSTHPAKEMVFVDLKPFNTYRYSLESFTESRSTEWTTEPYHGQFVDSYLCGVPPPPWNIIVERPPMFQKNCEKVPVPHTSSVKGCHTCLTLGRCPCRKCTATGKVRCWICSGRGYRLEDSQCSGCLGTGFQRCRSCSGQRTLPCGTCKQKGQLLVFIQLTVTWGTHVYQQVADQQCPLPSVLYEKVTGQLVFDDEQWKVKPILGFPEPQINQASQTAIENHQIQIAGISRIIRQRQKIEHIPVTLVDYKWKEKDFSYFVYGVENKVYAPDYPAKCCCTIL